MTTICAFCLSNDRNLSVIDKKYRKIVDSCFTFEDGKLEHLKCLQRVHGLQACWECSARLKNWYQFRSMSQLSVRVLNAYLGAPTQNLPITVSKLYTTDIEILEIGPKHEKTESEDVVYTLEIEPKYEETKTEDLADAPDEHVDEETETADASDTLDMGHVYEEIEKLDLEETSEILEDSQTPNLETSPLDNEYIINFVEPSGDDDVFYNNVVTKESSKEELPVQLPSEAGCTEATEENIISKPKSKGKSRSEPKCTVQWVSNEQAQTWYTNERRLEKVWYPTYTHICGNCQRVFVDEQELKAHFELQHSETIGNYMCHLCQYRFLDQALLKRHIESHYLLYKCKKCSYETRTLNSMQAHSRIEHNEQAQRRKQEKKVEKEKKEKPKKCTKCKNEFPSMSALRVHRAICNTYKCAECDKTYKSRGGYLHHMKRHRPEEIKKKEGVMYCEKCDIHFKEPAYYKHHMKFSQAHVPRESYKYQCEYCDMKFYSKNNMDRHTTSVHLKKGRFQCEVCPKSYNRRTVYQRHLANQHNIGKDEERNKTCDMCGKTFYALRLLQNHLRTHTGEKPYKCEFCPSAFAQTGSLYNHCLVTHKKKIIFNRVRISKGETFEDATSQEFVCDECGKTFMFKYRLRDHINYVHQGRTDYVCKYCNKMFSSPAGLTQHNKHTHDAKNKRNTEKMFSSPAGLTQHNKHTHDAKNKRNTEKKPQSMERIHKCRACDDTFRHIAALYTHYKLKHLKLKKGDRIRIRNLTRLDKEIIVEQAIPRLTFSEKCA